MFTLFELRAAVMALCLRARSCTHPAITTRCFATENIIRGKTSLATLTKKQWLRT